MDILFVSQYFYPESFKGNDIVFELIKKGHSVTVLTGKPNYPQGKFYDGYSFFGKRTEYINGAKIVRCPIYPRKNGKGVHLILNYLSFVFFSYFACIFRVSGKFDAVFVQQLSPVTVGLPGVWLKKKQKAKMFLWVLDLWPESFYALSNIKNRAIHSLIRKIVRYIYKNTDVFLVSSKSFISSIKSFCDTEKPIYYFPNWADETENFEINIPNLPAFPKGFNILFAGNIGNSQGLSYVLRAAKLARNINWIFIGDGRYLPTLKCKIKEEGLGNVYLFGRFPKDAMGAFFKSADVMLVSLDKDPVFAMTVPAKIQTYMSHGKIILGILDGEGRDLINELGIGVAVGAGDWQMLVEKATYLKSLDRTQRSLMENKSREEYLKKFQMHILISDLEKILISYIQ